MTKNSDLPFQLFNFGLSKTCSEDGDFPCIIAITLYLIIITLIIFNLWKSIQFFVSPVKFFFFALNRRNIKNEFVLFSFITETICSRASHDYEAERQQREATISKLQQSLAEIHSSQKVREHEVESSRAAIAKIKSDLAAIESVSHFKHLFF